MIQKEIDKAVRKYGTMIQKEIDKAVRKYNARVEKELKNKKNWYQVKTLKGILRVMARKLCVTGNDYVVILRLHDNVHMFPADGIRSFTEWEHGKGCK